jgi:hypothetical protein
LIGAAGAAEFCGIHIEKTLDHFVAVEGGDQEEGGFARADDEFSGTVGHARVSCTRMQVKLQLESVDGLNGSDCDGEEWLRGSRE